MQIQPVIAADLGVYPCHDKAYNNEALMAHLHHIGLKEWWLANKTAFFDIQPHIHCQHHCVANAKNEMLLAFLAIDPIHGAFV